MTFKTEDQFFQAASKAGRIWKPVLGLALAAIVVGGSYYTVDQGERGVKLRFGAVIGNSEAGLGFKMPMVESIVPISVRPIKSSYSEESYSFDQQPATINLSVTFHVQPDMADEVYAEYGSEQGVQERLVDPTVREQLKIVFGRYTSLTAIQQRGKLATEIEQAIRDALADSVMAIDGVQLENIAFSGSYMQSIDDRMKAEVEVATYQQNLAREKVQAEIRVTQAQATADSNLAEAKAAAEATRIQGEAEADAIRARAAALADNPNLVALVQAEKWNGQLPSTMIPGSTVPFMQMGGVTTSASRAQE